MEQSIGLIGKNQDKLLLDAGLLNKYRGKRYLVLITIKEFEEISPFETDRSEYRNMDDWFPVGNIEKVKIADE
ncbi:MAG: hypothetical protein AB9834_05490 [Lentimicrobium sp.]